jgi:hypothetical protein
MDAYCAEVRKLEKHFQGLEIHHVTCDLNIAVDVLAKLGSDRAQVPLGVFVEELSATSIKQPKAKTLDATERSTQIMIITPA